MRNVQSILMMVLVASAGVTVATEQDAPPAVLSERSLLELVQQTKDWSCPEDVKEETIRRIQAISELSQENVDALSEVASSYSLPGKNQAKTKIKELCMKILASNQMGQLLRDCVHGSDQSFARKKVQMLFTHCDVDITQANLVELAPAMKAFQDYVRADDPAAKAVDDCYYGHHKKYDLRDYYSVWQKKPVEELKSELNILQDIIEDHTVYAWVKWFYGKVQTDLINEIILKEPSFYHDPALGTKKHSISEKAKKAVDAWKKKAEADKKTEETNKRKNSSMQDLVNAFEQGYRQHKYTDAETAFTEREMSERENVQKEYSAKSFDDLISLLKTLGVEKKKYGESSDPHGFYRLRNKWIKMQWDEAETALLEKLKDAKPEDYQTLYDDHYDDNLGFSNKIDSAFEKVTDKVKADLVQTYQNMSDAERSKLEKKWGKEKYSTNRMKRLISRVTLEALEKVKKNQAKNVNSGQGAVLGQVPVFSGHESVSTFASDNILEEVAQAVPVNQQSVGSKKAGKIGYKKRVATDDSMDEEARTDDSDHEEGDDETTSANPAPQRGKSKSPVKSPGKKRSGKTPQRGRLAAKRHAKSAEKKGGAARSRSKRAVKKGVNNAVSAR
jgi:hypothetical protein